MNRRWRRGPEQIGDEVWRKRALQRIDDLPRLAAGPALGRSPQYAEAVTLVGKAHGATGTAAARIAVAEEAAGSVAELARLAPREEFMTIMRMNDSLSRLVEALRNGRL